MTGPFDLTAFVDARVWLAWRNERRGDKTTKVPYSAPGRKAKSDDPLTWIDLEPAAELAGKIDTGLGGGIGIFLGIDCGDGWQLGGIDLDTCRSDARIEPWAQEVIDRMNSYTEISPSKTGVKIFFRYQEADLARLRELMGTEHGKMFKRPGKDHPPAIEIYLGNRYFAVTSDLSDGFPSTLRAIEFDGLAWVILEAGPRFVGQGPVEYRGVNERAGNTVILDQSRSGVAFRKVCQLRQCGRVRSYVDMRTALLDDPETEGWTREKGLSNRERELIRLWACTRPAAGTVADTIADMADTFVEEGTEAASVPEPRQRKFRSRTEDRAAPAPKWLIEGLIPEAADVAIYAPMAYLKSFVALDIALAVATSTKALGLLTVVESGPVFYFAGEGYYDLSKKRAVAWEVEHGYESYGVTDIWFGNGAPITTDDTLIEVDIREIQGLLAGRRAKLFIIDTLNRALNGQDEDKSHVAARYLNAVKKIRDGIGGTSITIGHMGKDYERGERGSSAFAAGFDTIIWIEKCKKDEDTGVHTIQLFVRKQKDAEDGQRYWLQSKSVLTDGGDSLVLVPCTEEDGRAALDNKQTKGLTADEVQAALLTLTPLGGHVGTTQLAREIAQATGRKEHSVVAALSRNRGAGKKFQSFVFGEPRDGTWCLPGRHLNGIQSIDEMLDSFKEPAAEVGSQSHSVTQKE